MKSIAVAMPYFIDYAHYLRDGVSAYAQNHSDLQLIHFPIRTYGVCPIPEKCEVDGVLVWANELDTWALDWHESNKPIVSCSGDFFHKGMPDVLPKFPGVLVADYYKSLHLNDVAYITHLSTNTIWDLLQKNFISICTDRGLQCQIFEQDDSPSELPELLHLKDERTTELAAFIKQLPKPVGIWCVTDELAALVCNIATDLGLNIPADVQVIGDNDLPICRYHSPTISSIPSGGRQVGYEATRLLHQLMNDPASTKSKNWRLERPGIIHRESTGQKKAPNSQLGMAQDWINELACAGLTVDLLAQRMEISRVTLTEKYKKHYGVTPGEAIRQTRLEKAKNLLTMTDLPIWEIAPLCGYKSPAKFSEFIQRTLGITPSAYRASEKAHA